MANTNLVIVESPAKAKTIGKYLGAAYQVKACMGHLRDLPKSKIGVDIDHNFQPDYQPIKGKEEIIRDLKKLANNSQTVYLATDPDREGEAISWHLKELLQLPESKIRRVTFNEITKRVVSASIMAPREIDQNLVNAQQARRILDRIVGYQLSPLLWKKIRRGLSAGRVQSVATRMVCDREHEIAAFQPEEYWSLDVKLRTGANEEFMARYYGENGKKQELHNEEETSAVIDAVKTAVFTVKSLKYQDKYRSPAAPFTTSTLQQEASRKLSMTPRRTMAVAQQLYEGVDVIGVGTVGLITYMRTDSLRLSDEALEAARVFILSRYGEKYYPGKPRVYKSKANAQDAHEAIRPSNVQLIPEQIKSDLTSEQFRLYRLIWSRFVACQMANALYDGLSVEVEAAGHNFRASSTTLKFPGYTAVYEEGRDEEKDGDRSKEKKLPPLKEGQELTSGGFLPEQHFTQPPPHYTDATLIRALEENGIGRPSTYAPTVTTILEREYVVKEEKYLHSTPLGETVNRLMCDKFADIVDERFTAEMEKELDGVEEGRKDWHTLLQEFYGPFHEHLEKAEHELEGVRLKIPVEESDEVCEVCGRKMVIKSGRFGRFLACPGYPECTFTKPLVVVMPGCCPLCGGRILKKVSRNGHLYYGCEFNNSKDESKKCAFMTWDIPTEEDCPSCGQTMFKNSGRGFRKPFCINERCANFTPEDQRGGYRKKTAKAEGSENTETEAATEASEEKLEEKSKEKSEEKSKKKAAEKKTAAKKTAKAKE